MLLEDGMRVGDKSMGHIVTVAGDVEHMVPPGHELSPIPRAKTHIGRIELLEEQVRELQREVLRLGDRAGGRPVHQ